MELKVFFQLYRKHLQLHLNRVCECATVCGSVCVPQFHLQSFKVPNEMRLRVLWACSEELNFSLTLRGIQI